MFYFDLSMTCGGLSGGQGREIEGGDLADSFYQKNTRKMHGDEGEEDFGGGWVVVLSDYGD